jgi:hypothetical protein
MRTKRARRWRRVLFHRSTWAVSPVSLPTAVCCSEGDHHPVRRPEIREAVTSTVAVWNAFPQPLARPFTPIPNRRGDQLSALSAQGNPHPDLPGFFEHKRPQFVPFQRDGRYLIIRGGVFRKVDTVGKPRTLHWMC